VNVAFFIPNKLFSQLYHMTGAICISTICKQIWIFTVLTHWNNIGLVDMRLHSSTLSWYSAKHSYSLILHA